MFHPSGISTMNASRAKPGTRYSQNPAEPPLPLFGSRLRSLLEVARGTVPTGGIVTMCLPPSKGWRPPRREERSGSSRPGALLGDALDPGLVLTCELGQHGVG